MRFFWYNYWYQNSIFRVLVTIEPSRSLLRFVTTNCLINRGGYSWQFSFWLVSIIIFNRQQYEKTDDCKNICIYFNNWDYNNSKTLKRKLKVWSLVEIAVWNSKVPHSTDLWYLPQDDIEDTVGFWLLNCQNVEYILTNSEEQ